MTMIRDYERTNQQLGEMRRSILLGKGKDPNLSALYNYLKGIEYEYVERTVDDLENVFNTPILKGVPVTISVSLEEVNGSIIVSRLCPDILSYYINFFRTSENIDMSNVENIVITIYPPAKVESSFMTEISPRGITVVHRFLLFCGSDEKVYYAMMNQKTLSEVTSMSTSQHVEEYDVPECCDRFHVKSFPQMMAISLKMRFNDEPNYEIREYNNRPKTNKKLPRNRYAVVVDFMCKNSHVKSSFTSHMNALKKAVSSGGKSSEVAKNKIKELNKRIKEETGEDLELDIDKDFSKIESTLSNEEKGLIEGELFQQIGNSINDGLMNGKSLVNVTCEALTNVKQSSEDLKQSPEYVVINSEDLEQSLENHQNIEESKVSSNETDIRLDKISSSKKTLSKLSERLSSLF